MQNQAESICPEPRSATGGLMDLKLSTVAFHVLF